MYIYIYIYIYIYKYMYIYIYKTFMLTSRKKSCCQIGIVIRLCSIYKLRTSQCITIIKLRSNYMRISLLRGES